MTTYTDELQRELDDELNIEDQSQEEEIAPVTRYDITSYGIDFDVEGLIKRIKRGDIFIPPFQRNYVWKLTEASRLVESLLLGLPVPGIFLAQDQETGKMLVIDGQQRLLSLYYFFEGYFNPKPDESRRRVFKLDKVQPQFEGKTYVELDSKDRINLENCVIHATVVKQDSPAEDDTSIYHIFERLNSGGRKLAAQEIRTAVFHGELIDKVKAINDYPSWRKIYGRSNDRMKDQELILRYFAMLEGWETYKPPMSEFISLFCKKHRSNNNGLLDEYTSLFQACCDHFVKISNGRPFRLGSALNVAFFESAMIGLSIRLRKDSNVKTEDIAYAYEKLRKDPNFLQAISQSTGNPSSLESRMSLAVSVFSKV